MNRTEQLVRKLHAFPDHPKVVLAITGGGAEVIGMLLKHGGGSNTLLEAVVPYDQHAFDDFVKGKPDKYCSAGAARDLAMAAYIRACKLTGNPDVLGVGASCSLQRDGTERAGRQHHVYVALQNRHLTGSYEYEILHKGQATREQEEAFAAEAILNAIVAGSALEGVTGFLDQTGLKYECTSDVVGHAAGQALILGEKHIHTKVINPPDVLAKYVLPGAFNPIHQRHLEIAQAVHKLKGERVDFELCIRNVDKPPLNYYDLRTREEGLWNALNLKPYAGNLHFTTAPTFAEKAELFQGCTFVVGMDTFLRIGDLKYYNNDEERRYKAIDRIRALGCRFLVFNRIINGVATRTEDCLKVPHFLTNLAEPITDDVLPPSDMSSTKLRTGK